MTLRFRHAIILTAICLACSLLAVLTKPGLDPALQLAFSIQILTTCALSSYANYISETRRCADYLAKLEADLQATNAEMACQQSHVISRTDALTQLPNRLYLQERLTEWFGQHPSITVMMIDIDFFKPYNDALGHLEGDRCLREIARLFAAAGDAPNIFCARYGGEEFTLAVQGTSEADAMRLARRLLHGVEDMGIPHPARPDDLSRSPSALASPIRRREFSTHRAHFLPPRIERFTAQTTGQASLRFDGDWTASQATATA